MYCKNPMMITKNVTKANKRMACISSLLSYLQKIFKIWGYLLIYIGPSIRISAWNYQFIFAGQNTIKLSDQIEHSI